MSGVRIGLAYRVEGKRVECAVGSEEWFPVGKKSHFSQECSMLERCHYGKKGKAESAPANHVDKYIAKTPKAVQGKLREIRAAIRDAAPGATERTDYFEWPGYSYEGYDYDGMFVWFSFKEPYVRLHVRPPVIQNHKKDLAGLYTTKAVVGFPADRALSKALVKRLVKASIKVMRDKAKAKPTPKSK